MKHSKKYVIHKKTKLILLIQIIILIMGDIGKILIKIEMLSIGK